MIHTKTWCGLMANNRLYIKHGDKICFLAKSQGIGWYTPETAVEALNNFFDECSEIGECGQSTEMSLITESDITEDLWKKYIEDTTTP